jgi:hypothetical protein
MDELLPHYEVELRRLAADAARFALQHPALAQRLGITGEGLSEDPQVERLMQAAALLNARASLHIENSQARLTGGLLQRLAPQYLRPFPACAIAAFEPDASKLAAGETLTVPRGTTLRGVRCAFRTAYGLTLPPLRVAGIRLRGRTAAAPGTPLPAGTTALLSLRLALTAKEAAWPADTQPPLRLHLRGPRARLHAGGQSLRRAGQAAAGPAGAGTLHGAARRPASVERRGLRHRARPVGAREAPAGRGTAGDPAAVLRGVRRGGRDGAGLGAAARRQRRRPRHDRDRRPGWRAGAAAARLELVSAQDARVLYRGEVRAGEIPLL